MTRDNIFLTEKRQEILNEESDWSKESITNEKSRIRNRSKDAIEELTQVAQSPAIENESVFDPEKLGTLLHWILYDPAKMKIEGGLIGTGEPPEGVDESAWNRIPDDLQQYQREVHSQTANELLSIDYPERGRQR